MREVVEPVLGRRNAHAPEQVKRAGAGGPPRNALVAHHHFNDLVAEPVDRIEREAQVASGVKKTGFTSTEKCSCSMIADFLLRNPDLVISYGA